MAPSSADPSSSTSSPTKQKRKHKDSPSKSPSKKSKEEKRASKSARVEANPAPATAPGQATLKLAKNDGLRSSSGIALASFSDYLPADSAEFDLYRADGFPGSSSGTVKGGLRDERLMLAGGTKSMEYLGDNFQLGAASELRGYSGEYMVGVYDPSTSSVTLRAAPLFTVSRSIKALKTLDALSFDQDEDDGISMFYKQRKGLEGTFGNAKARKARVNQERMKVDITQVFGSMDQVTEGIAASTSNLPSAEELQAIDFRSRPIPPHVPTATRPVEVYPIKTLIEPSVMKQVPIEAVLELKSEDEARAFLAPLQASFLAGRLWNVVQNAQFDMPDPPPGASQDVIDSFAKRQNMARDDAHDRVKMVMYLVYLVSFMLLFPNTKNVGKVQEKMGLGEDGRGRKVVRDIADRFTSTAKGTSKIYISGMEQTKFLSYACALLLHLDHFTVAYEPIAKGLHLEPYKLMDIFRAIGCRPSKKEVPSGDADFGESKKERAATLSLPLEFPKPRRKRAGK